MAGYGIGWSVMANGNNGVTAKWRNNLLSAIMAGIASSMAANGWRGGGWLSAWRRKIIGVAASYGGDNQHLAYNISASIQVG